jgi:SAM-dependent methyltransferase
VSSFEESSNAASPGIDTTSQSTGREHTIYTRRFSEGESEVRSITWQVLCSDFLQKFVSPNDVVVDVGAGDGNFIRHIKARRRIAVDLSEHVLDLKKYDLEVLHIPGTELASVLDEPADVIFMSNFLEHMPSKRVMLDVLEGARAALKPGGRIMILQPNIRAVGVAYWDYIDHHIALTEHSLCEALEICGFKPNTVIPRFLPYTVKSKVGKLVSIQRSASLIRWYLKIPLLWKIFGAQTFVEAKAV